jgi:hypothetical protein
MSKMIFHLFQATGVDRIYKPLLQEVENRDAGAARQQACLLGF